MNALLLMTVLLGCPDPQEACELQPITTAEAGRLVELRQCIESLEFLKKTWYDYDPDGSSMNTLLGQVEELSHGRAKTYQELVSLTGGDFAPPTPWQQFKGLVTFVNIMWIAGAILIGTALMWLFGFYFLSLILLIPEQGWEVILWSGLSAIIWSAHSVDPSWQLAILMPACVGYIGAVALSCHLHGGDSRSYEVPSIILAVAWSIVAVTFGSHVIGFMAIMAVLSSLGFIAGHFPGVVYIGFEKDDVVPRATFAAFCMIALHVLFTATGNEAKPIVVFREGMNFMGSFVFFLGILVMSSKWYWYFRERSGFGYSTDWKSYSVMQVVALAVGLLAFYFGSVFGMSALLGIGGTFFCLYVLEKYYELPWSGVGWAWSLLGLGGLLYVFGIMAKTYPQYFLFG